jgi:hypothetical protein
MSRSAGITTPNSYGQVEPNMLSALVSGDIFAQLPLDPDEATFDALENGRFLVIDYVNSKITTPENATTDAQAMLVYNERRHFDERLSAYSDFAILREWWTDDNFPYTFLSSQTAPATPDVQPGYLTRLFGTRPNTDILTTNTTAEAIDTYNRGDLLNVNATGYLTSAAGYISQKAQWVVVRNGKPADASNDGWTLPDGQPAIQVQRIV